jgi:hypothetical protein
VTGREHVAQGLPPADLGGFPPHPVVAATVLYRAHGAGLGPWWFGNDGGGRFDLADPHGTCYTALDADSAVRERLGPVLAGRSTVPESALADTIVSRLHVPEPVDAADLQARGAAAFGVTRELQTMVPYVVPQAWARALHRAGWGAVAYGPRFTPGPGTAVALFGDHGASAWPGDPAPMSATQASPDLEQVPTPRRADLTVVRPPRTRTVRS